MRILLLGGTGAMGEPLRKLLSAQDNEVLVTSRSPQIDEKRVHYILGNAKEESFFNKLMDTRYDVIVDFMVYGTNELRKRLPIILTQTRQYVFFSSSRCYFASKNRITEDSSRLVDVCEDLEYLKTDEYGLAKGREENLLMSSSSKNWTIIRPYITYNTYRMQLGVYEKEDWLRRALAGRTIVFPKDIAEKKTSLTYGPDVAKVLLGLIGNEKAYGEAFHITTEESHSWMEILELYVFLIKKKTGREIKVKLVDDSKGLQTVWNPWQIRYDRLYDREFDNSKIDAIIGKYTFKPTFQGIEECLEEFLCKPRWLHSKPKYEAWCDKQTGEFTPFTVFSGKKEKISYIKHRIFD